MSEPESRPESGRSETDGREREHSVEREKSSELLERESTGTGANRDRRSAVTTVEEPVRRHLGTLLQFLLDALTGVVALFTAYVVIGGIWTGQNTILTGAPPTVHLLLTSILIFWIGGLEGLQISVSNLQKKDLAELVDEYPSAVRLHEQFRNDDEVMKRFFGGRQFLIVALVFTASRLTTFPTMHSFPFTTVPFPSLITPWFQFLFLDLGLLGALFVLWLGNLTAQFVATDHPVEFLSIPGMRFLFALCVWVDRVRLPRPANWLSAYLSGRIGRSSRRMNAPSRSNRSRGLPVSSEERWRRELESESGFVLTNVCHEWHLHENRVERVYRSTYLIGQDGIGTLIDDGFLVPKHVQLASCNSFRWNAWVEMDETPSQKRRESVLARWLRRSEPSAETADEEESTASSNLSFDRFHQTVYRDDVAFDNYLLSFSNRNGCFEPGTKIHVEVEADFTASPTELTRDCFFVSHQCKKLRVRLEYSDSVETRSRPKLFIYGPIHEKIPKSENCNLIRLAVRSGQRGGRAYSTYDEGYPQDQSRYEVTWNVRSPDSE